MKSIWVPNTKLNPPVGLLGCLLESLERFLGAFFGFIFGVILMAWGRFLAWFWCLGKGFCHHFPVLVAVFGIMSWSWVHLGSENQVEPSSGTSRALSGIVLGGPGGLLASNWASIWGALLCFCMVFWRCYFLALCDSILEGVLIRFCEHFYVPSSFV